MAQTLGQRLGVVTMDLTDPNKHPELNQRILHLAFSQLVTAVRQYTLYVDSSSAGLDDATVTKACQARAGVMGHALHFAQLLGWGDRVWPITPSVRIDVSEYAKSADALIALVRNNWLPQLPKISLNDDRTWELFFEAVKAYEAYEQDANPAKHIEGLIARAGGDIYQWGRQVEYYATKVAPDWRLWLRGIDGIELPRL